MFYLRMLGFTTMYASGALTFGILPALVDGKGVLNQTQYMAE